MLDGVFDIPRLYADSGFNEAIKSLDMGGAAVHLYLERSWFAFDRLIVEIPRDRRILKIGIDPEVTGFYAEEYMQYVYYRIFEELNKHYRVLLTPNIILGEN